MPGTDPSSLHLHGDRKVALIEGQGVPDADAAAARWVGDLTRPEKFLLAVSIEGPLGDLRDLDHGVNVPGAVAKGGHLGHRARCQGLQICEICIVEDLDARGPAEIQLWRVAEASNLSAVDLQQRADVVVKRLPRKEPDGPGVVGQSTTNDIDGTRAVFSVNLVGSAGKHPANHANVPLLRYGADVKRVVGRHGRGHTLFEDDDSSGLVDVQRHLPVVFVDARSFNSDDAAGGKVGVRTPIFVVPAGSLAVLFPRVVLKHSEGDLLLFAANHLIADVVRDDGDLNFHITVCPGQFGETRDFLRLSRLAPAARRGRRGAALESAKNGAHGVLWRDVKFLFVLRKGLGHLGRVGIRAFFEHRLDVVGVLFLRHVDSPRQALLFLACTENRRRAFVRVG